MVVMDKADREMLEYLQFLVKHTDGCEGRSCQLCASLRAVCDDLANHLFSTDFYPEIAKSAKRPALAAHETESGA